MKLLLLGSLLVLLGVVALAGVEWAAFGVALGPERIALSPRALRFVDVGRDGGSAPSAVVWQTSTSLEDCTGLVRRGKREQNQRIADLLSSGPSAPPPGEDENTCDLFRIGEVETGTEVEVLDEYGRMAKVRVLSGRLRGREGFIQAEQLGKGAG